MNDIAAQKLAAEVDLLRAQAKKLEFENQAPKTTGRLLDSIKLIGSLILGLGGVTAAITGYQSAQLKKERTEFEMAQLQADLRTRQTELDEVALQVESKKAEYAKTTAEIEKLQRSLIELEKTLSQNAAVSAASKQQLETAIAATSVAKEQINVRQMELRAIQNTLNKPSPTNSRLLKASQISVDK